VTDRPPRDRPPHRLTDQPARQLTPGRLARRVALVVLGVWLLVAISQVFLAALHVRAGQRAVRTAQANLNAAEISNPAGRDLLAPVRSEFAAAQDQLSGWVLAPVRAIPVIGRQVRATAALARAATRVAVVGQATVLRARAALGAPHHTGPERLTAIRALSLAAHDADRQLATITLPSASHLIGPVVHARNQFADRLARVRAGLTRGVAGAQGALSLLSGPSHVLVLMANNAEMRNGSGMFLSAAALDTSNGSVHLGAISSTSSLHLPPGAVPLTGDMAARWDWVKPNEEWRNLAVSARFDTTAALAAQMWKAAKGEDVDGVLGLDVETLKAILQGTGALDVAGTNVTADNVEQLVMHDQYVGVSVTDAGQAARKERLGQIANAALQAVQDGSFDVARLATALAAVTSGRHFLAWSAHPEQQQQWEQAQVAGQIGAHDLLVAVLNRGANKLDQFLDVSSQLTVRPGASATDVTVAVKLADHTPEGEPPYVAESFAGSGVNTGDYLGLVTLTMPGAATGITVDGVSAVNVLGADGMSQVVALLRVVPKGQSLTVTAHFRLPGRHGLLQTRPSARVPAAGWSAVGSSVTWRDDQPRNVVW